jgi:hypothetical protein
VLLWIFNFLSAYSWAYAAVPWASTAPEWWSLTMEELLGAHFAVLALVVREWWWPTTEKDRWRRRFQALVLLWIFNSLTAYSWACATFDWWSTVPFEKRRAVAMYLNGFHRAVGALYIREWLSMVVIMITLLAGYIIEDIANWLARFDPLIQQAGRLIDRLSQVIGAYLMRSLYHHHD